MKTEREKMLAGEYYNPADKELIERWHLSKRLMLQYATADTRDNDLLNRILDQLLGSYGENVWIAPPIYVDYGDNIHIGNNTEINMNCTFLDCNRITIGDNTTIGAGSVVTKSIPANCLAVGSPCKVIKYFE